MLRPPVKSLIIHGLFFYIGLGGAMLFTPHLPTPSASRPTLNPERTHRKERSAAGMRLSSPSSFRSAYSALITRSMSSSERSACMEELWKQWSATNPIDMLTFLEKKRVWPQDCKIYNDFGLSDRPDIMLDFALRHGSSEMLQKLLNCDSSAIARLLATLPVEQKGSDIIEVDIKNDRELGWLGLEIKEPSPAYLRGVAESLLERGKIDEFLSAFREVGNPREMNELAMKFGDTLSHEKPSDEVLALLLRLPEEYRQAAAENLMRNADSSAMEFSEVRDARKRWIEKFAAQGFIEAATSGVDDLFSEERAANQGKEIAAWVARFPSDGSWQPITQAIIRAWQGSDHDGMIPQICALPEGPVRATLATEAATHTIGGLAQEYDQEQQIIHDRLAALFTEPEARAKFEKKFAPWSERSIATDPNAPEQDPFATPE